MENEENTQELELDEQQNQEEETQDENQDDTQNQEDSEQDTTDWKAEALKQKAINDRLSKRLNNGQNKESSSQTKSDNLDWGQKAFLVANGVKGSDEMKLAQDFAKNTGKSLDDVVVNKYFLQELQDFRELKTTAQAVPKGKGKVSNSSQDSIDYWLAKPFGELPEDFELRKKVVAERRKRSKNAGMFN